MKEKKMIGDHLNEMLKTAAANAPDLPDHEFVKKMRKFVGFNQNFVATVLDCHKYEVSKYERYGLILPQDKIDQLKQLFGRNPEPVQDADPSLLKKCATCNEEKSLNDYYRKKRADGTELPDAECKACTSKRGHRNREEKRKIDDQVQEWMTAGTVRRPRAS